MFTRDWLLCRPSAARAPSLNIAQLCCIPLQNPVGPFPALYAIFPTTENAGICTGIAKWVVKLYLSSSFLLLFLWMRNLLFVLKGAQGKEEIATTAISTLFPSDGKCFACNCTSLVWLACVLLALSVPRSRSRRALRA